jgi:hypothetical protein
MWPFQAMVGAGVLLFGAGAACFARGWKSAHPLWIFAAFILAYFRMWLALMGLAAPCLQ